MNQTYLYINLPEFQNSAYQMKVLSICIKVLAVMHAVSGCLLSIFDMRSKSDLLGTCNDSPSPTIGLLFRSLAIL